MDAIRCMYVVSFLNEYVMSISTINNADSGYTTTSNTQNWASYILVSPTVLGISRVHSLNLTSHDKYLTRSHCTMVYDTACVCFIMYLIVGKAEASRCFVTTGQAD